MYLSDLVWRTLNEGKVIPANPSQPIDTSLFEQYDICITDAAMKQFQFPLSWNDPDQNS